MAQLPVCLPHSSHPILDVETLEIHSAWWDRYTQNLFGNTLDERRKRYIRQIEDNSMGSAARHGGPSQCLLQNLVIMELLEEVKNLKLQQSHLKKKVEDLTKDTKDVRDTPPHYWQD